MAEDQGSDEAELDEPDDTPSNAKGNGTVKQPDKSTTNEQVESLQVKNLKASIRNKKLVSVLLVIFVTCVCCWMITVGLQFVVKILNSIAAGATGPY